MKSLSNRQTSLVNKLTRPAQRRKSGYFVAEGERAAEQVIRNPAITCDFILVPEELHESLQHKFANVPVRTGQPDLLNRLADTEHSQHIFAVCREPAPAMIEDLGNQSGLIIACDALQDPGNLGTIYRTASWFGAVGWLHGKGTVDLFNSKVVRSTAGVTGAIPYTAGDPETLLPELVTQGWQIHLLDTGSHATPIQKWQPSPRQVLVIGSEGHGPSSVLSEKFPALEIPPTAAAPPESLNAGVAAGIAMFCWAESATE